MSVVDKIKVVFTDGTKALFDTLEQAIAAVEGKAAQAPEAPAPEAAPAEAPAEEPVASD